MKKGNLLLQRPVRTFDDEPDQGAPQIEPKPGIPDGLQPTSPEEPRDKKVRTLNPRKDMASTSDSSNKFGPLTVDLATVKKREPKGLLTTTVPSILHGRLMQREEGPSGFINQAVQKYLRTDLNRVVEAGYRLGALRVAQAEDSRTISARAPMTHVADVDEAGKYVTRTLEKVSAAFIVGGCVLLMAEEQGLVGAQKGM